MIGVLVPVHNEEQMLGNCLAALARAAIHPRLEGEEVRMVLVLDACSDGSASVAATHCVDLLHIDARNVGLARAAGACHLLAAGARWLACTDADSCVADDWLVQQMHLQRHGAEVVCGTVAVNDWSSRLNCLLLLRQRFEALYTDADGHRHIHGANLGICALAYVRAGGFPALACSEDVALVQALEAAGANIAWSAAPRVVTSARVESKARGGFGDALTAMVSG